jgi:hypothetical protein
MVAAGIACQVTPWALAQIAGAGCPPHEDCCGLGLGPYGGRQERLQLELGLDELCSRL